MADTSDTDVALIAAFVQGSLSPDRFCDKFLTMWRDDRDSGRTSGEVIDRLMTGVDCYNGDPDSSNAFDIDADALRVEASEALSALREQG